MRLEDLGIDPKTGRHDKRLTQAESKFVGILWVVHVGQDNIISADLLAIQYFVGFGQDVDQFLAGHDRATLEEWKRDIRRMQNHLLMDHDNIPVLSRAGVGGGYWIADSDEEAAQFYDRFRKRGLTGIYKAARGKKAALVDMVQQMTFEFEELQDKTPPLAIKREKAAPALPAPVEVVDAFLSRMLKNPEKFSDGLKMIREKYGSVLMPREHVAALKAKAAELSAMVAGL